MRAPLLLILIGLSACTRPATVSGDDFARLTAGRIAGPAQTCVSSISSEGLHVVDSATLAYGSGRTVYVNRLGASCPGLRDFSTIIVENASGQYCRNDRIRALEVGAIIPGPSCLLGDWVPYKIR
jgi:hypothetical protein